MSSGGRPMVDTWQRPARIKQRASGPLPDPGVHSAQELVCTLSGVFGDKRILRGENIECPGPVNYRVTVGSFGQPAIPCRMRVDGLEKTVVTSVQFYRKMMRGTFHVDIIVATLEARQLVAGMQAHDIGPGRKLHNIPLQHPFVALHEIGIIRRYISVIVVQDYLDAHLVRSIGQRYRSNLSYFDFAR